MDEQLCCLDSLTQADLVRAPKASPADLEAEASERISRGPGFNALAREAAFGGPPVDAHPHDAALLPSAASAPVAGVPLIVMDLSPEIEGTPFARRSQWDASPPRSRPGRLVTS